MAEAEGKLPLLLPLRVILSFRIFLYPNFFAKYLRLGIWRKLVSANRLHDPFYFLQHRYHLSKRLTVRQRVASAITHHEYEFQNYLAKYEQEIYRGDGLVLWEHEIDNHNFRIILTGSESNRNEGELSVVLSGDEKNFWKVSFSYVCGSTFLLKKRVFLFLTRSQSEAEDKKLFHACFAQNQPQLFCLSAVCGVAQANGWESILAIRHDHQIAYEEKLQSGFYNSYTALWKKFDAREIGGHVYELATPLKVRPLNEVSRSHRSRARARREFWDSISRSACATLIGYRRRPAVGIGGGA